MIENTAVEEEMAGGYGPDDHLDPYIQGTEALDRPEYMFAGSFLYNSKPFKYLGLAYSSIADS